MSQPLNADQELVSDVVACQLVIKQILDVHRANPIKKPLLQKNEAAVSQKLHRRNALAPMYDQCS